MKIFRITEETRRILEQILKNIPSELGIEKTLPQLIDELLSGDSDRSAVEIGIDIISITQIFTASQEIASLKETNQLLRTYLQLKFNLPSKKIDIKELNNKLDDGKIKIFPESKEFINQYVQSELILNSIFFEIEKQCKEYLSILLSIPVINNHLLTLKTIKELQRTWPDCKVNNLLNLNLANYGIPSDKEDAKTTLSTNFINGKLSKKQKEDVKEKLDIIREAIKDRELLPTVASRFQKEVLLKVAEFIGKWAETQSSIHEADQKVLSAEQFNPGMLVQLKLYRTQIEKDTPEMLMDCIKKLLDQGYIEYKPKLKELKEIIKDWTSLSQYNKVHYMEKKEQNENEIFIQDGRFIRFHKTNEYIESVSASTSTLKSHNKDKWGLLVVTPENKILTRSYEPYKCHHSSLSQGLPVAFAGEIRINENGNLTGITLYSGHYESDVEDLYRILIHFKNQGLDLSKCMVYLPNRANLHSTEKEALTPRDKAPNSENKTPIPQDIVVKPKNPINIHSYGESLDSCYELTAKRFLQDQFHFAPHCAKQRNEKILEELKKLIIVIGSLSTILPRKMTKPSEDEKILEQLTEALIKIQTDEENESENSRKLCVKILDCIETHFINLSLFNLNQETDKIKQILEYAMDNFNSIDFINTFPNCLDPQNLEAHQDAYDALCADLAAISRHSMHDISFFSKKTHNTEEISDNDIKEDSSDTKKTAEPDWMQDIGAFIL